MIYCVSPTGDRCTFRTYAMRDGAYRATCELDPKLDVDMPDYPCMCPLMNGYECVLHCAMPSIKTDYGYDWEHEADCKIGREYDRQMKRDKEPHRRTATMEAT